MNKSQHVVKNVNRQFIIETNSNAPNNLIELFLNQMLPGDYKIKSKTVPIDWEQFKDYIDHLHEVQNEGCRGCKQPTPNCKECMQKYYWDNISNYLKYNRGIIQ